MRTSSRTTPTPHLLALALLFGVALVGSWVLAADAPAPEATTPSNVAATLKGHTEAVYAIAFTPDGKYVLTGSFDHSLKMFEAATGREVKTFAGPAGHQNLVVSLAVSPDGQMVASGSVDNTVKVWDVPSTSPLRAFTHTDKVGAISLSPDGKVVAGAADDGTVKLWNTADGKQLFNMPGHTGAITGLAFSPSGQMLVSSGSDHTLRFWNPASGMALGTLDADAAITGVAFNPANNNAVYTIGADGLLKFWQLPLTAPRPTPAHGDAVTAVALSADGNQVVTASADKSVRIAPFANPQQSRTLPAAGAGLLSVALAPNGTLVAAGGSDQRLSFWTAADGKLLSNHVAHAGAVRTVAFSPQGDRLLSGGEDGQIKLWTMPPLPAQSLPHPDDVLAAALTADGKHLFTAGADKLVRSWNLATPPNQAERQFAGHTAPVAAVAVSANGQVLASGGADDTIRFWNQANGQQTAILGAHGGGVTSLTFNAGGTQLLSTGADGAVKLWQLPVTPPKPFLHPDQVTSAAVSPDGAKLLTGCTDKQARLWNLTTGQVERELSGNTLAVTAVAYSGNGTLVAAGGADKSVSVWQAADGKEVKRFAGLSAAVQSVALSPDGKFVAAGLADNSLRILDVWGQGKEARSLAGHTGPVTALVYTPRGDRLLSASADKTVQVWDPSDGSNKGKLEHGAAVACLALSKDGARVASGGEQTVKVWTVADGKAAATLTAPAAIHGVNFSPDGDRLLVAAGDRAYLYTTQGQVLEFFAHEGPVTAVAFHPNGKSVLSASADKTARAWVPAVIWQARHTGAARQALFTPKGDQVFSAGDDQVKVWNAADGKEVRSLAAHDGAVAGLGVSADGLKLVTAGADKTVKLWDLTPPKPGVKSEDKPLTTIALPAAARCVTINPNGTRIAAGFSAGKENVIRVFAVPAGGRGGVTPPLLTIPDHTGAINSLAFAADNRTLLSTSADRSARLSDVNVVAAWEGHVGGVSGVAFDGKGTQALSAGADKTVKLWDLTTGKAVQTFGPLDAPVSAVAFSRDFTQVGAAAGKGVSIWTLDGKLVRTLAHPADVTSLSFSVDGRGGVTPPLLVTGAADNLARVWDLAGGKELEAFRHAGPVQAVVFHPNNTSIVSGSADKTAAVWTLAAVRVIPASEAALRTLAVTPTGTHVLTAGDDKAVKMWNLTSGANERTFAGAEGAVTAVAVSRNNTLVATGGADKSVRLYTLADAGRGGVTPPLLVAFQAPAAVQRLTFSPNNQILVACCADKAVLTWDVTFTPGQPPPEGFGKPLQPFAHEAGVTDLAFAPDSVTLYSGSLDKTVKAWHFASNVPTKNLGHPNLVDSVAFSPDGTELATGCHDGQVRIWDVAKGTQTRQINAHPTPPQGNAVYCVAWSPDGKQLVSASLDQSLKLWDAKAGTLVREFKGYKEKMFEKGHRDGVFAVAFSPDGKTIASGSSDRTIKIWNVADGSVLRDCVNPNLKPSDGVPLSHPGWVYSLRFTADGKYLVSAGPAPQNRGFLGVWSAADGKMVYGEELPLGAFHAMALSPDGKSIAVACGPQGKPFQEVSSFILKMPEVK